MLVIDGKNQKSLKIQELSKEWGKEGTLYVDNKEGLKFLDSVNSFQTIEQNTALLLNTVSNLMEYNKTFKKVNRIVLYLNIDFSELKIIKEFESELKKYNKDFIECVITVQSEEEQIGVHSV